MLPIGRNVINYDLYWLASLGCCSHWWVEILPLLSRLRSRLQVYFYRSLYTTLTHSQGGNLEEENVDRREFRGCIFAQYFCPPPFFEMMFFDAVQ